MKTRSIVALILAFVLTFSLFAACGKDPASSELTAADATSKKSESDTETAASDQNKNDTEDKTPAVSELKAEKTGSIPMSKIYESDKILKNPETRYNGIGWRDGGFIIHDETGKYSFVSWDGEPDTDKVYTAVSGFGPLTYSLCDPYYTVTQKELPLSKDPAALNCFGLVDASGKEIFPQEYASFETLSERFVYAIKVTSATEDDLNNILWLEGTLFGESEDTSYYYNGVAELYDLETMKTVPGFTKNTTDEFYADADGAFLSKTTENEGNGSKYYDAEGNLLEHTKALGDGFYVVEEDGTGTLYDADGKQMFTYDSSKYSLAYFFPDAHEDIGHFLQYEVTEDPSWRWSYQNGAKFIVDKNGKRLTQDSEEQDVEYYDLGTCYYWNGKLYEKDKTEPVNESHGIGVDPVYGRGYLLYHEDKEEFYAPDGTLLKTIDIEPGEGLVNAVVWLLEPDRVISSGEKVNKTDGTYWFASVDGEKAGTKDVIDLYNGNKLITGYQYYEFYSSRNEETIIIAINDSAIDLYTIKK